MANTINPDFSAWNSRERELLAEMERRLCSPGSTCVTNTLICPEDQGVIRATQAQGTVTLTATAAVAIGGKVDLILPNLGLNYCLSFGLQLAATANVNGYTVDIIRAGNVVGGTSFVELSPATNNDARCQCCICVGALQPITLRFTNTGSAPWVVGESITIRVCRDFDNAMKQKGCC